MLGVGNVGESLAPYKDSDTFLTRDAGFTWEEVHKDAHMWEFGDSGSVIIIVNDEEPVDHVQYTLDEGKTWREYKFGERLRITNLMTVPEDTSRKFLLIGYPPREQDKAHAVFLDFSSVNKRPCGPILFRLATTYLIRPQVLPTRHRVTLSFGAPARNERNNASSVARFVDNIRRHVVCS